MKILVALAISIELVSILSCPMVRAAPSIPDYVEIVAPNPSLPKELAAFFGKYEGVSGAIKFFVIVAQIDKEKATIYIFREGNPVTEHNGWEVVEAEVFKERGKYQLWYHSRVSGHLGGSSQASLEGKYLQLTSGVGRVKLSRVP